MPETNSSVQTEVTLPYTLPQNEYMYGCVCTEVAAILGYYDKYGYLGYDVSNLIDGDISVYSRGTDGNSYDMNAFDTVLGNFTVTQSHLDRFYETTPAEELKRSFSGNTSNIDTSHFDCLADWLGTGQYWRKAPDLSTNYYVCTLQSLLNSTQTYTISSGSTSKTLSIQWADFKYGLHRYVQSRGYSLNTEKTRTVRADVTGGAFSFEDYMAEIDAGRPVLLSLLSTNGSGHMVAAFGYDASKREIIFDDCYRTDCRMTWDGSYFYSDEDYFLNAVSTIVFNTKGLEPFAGGEPVDAPSVNFLAQALVLSSKHNATVQAESFQENEIIYLNFTVRNTGDAAPCEILVDISVDGKLFKTVTAPALDSRQSFQFKNISLGTLAAGSHVISVMADCDNHILEGNEDDNLQTCEINVVTQGEGRTVIDSAVTYSRENASLLFVTSGGRVSAVDGSELSDIHVAQGGELVAQGGASVSEMQLDGGGSAVLSSGGTARDTTIGSQGKLSVKDNGVASNTTVGFHGDMRILSGGNAVNTKIERGGNLVASGGSLSNVTLLAGGSAAALFSSGTVVSGLHVRQSAVVSAAGARLQDIVFDGMEFYERVGGVFLDGTTAAQVTLRRGHTLVVGSGASVRDVLVEENGTLEVAKGGVAENVTVLQEGYYKEGLCVSSGGTLRDLHQPGGTVQLLSGAKLEGKLELGGRMLVNGNVNASAAEVGFLLTSNANKPILQGGLDRLEGASSYSVLLDDTADGNYILATDVNSFSGSITVRNKFWEAEGAALQVGSQDINAWFYSLSLSIDNGNLILAARRDLTLDTESPVWNGTVDISRNQHTVGLSWQQASDNTFIDHYEVRIDGNLHATETTSFTRKLTAGEHKIAVRAVDAAGNVSEWSDEETVTIDRDDFSSPVFTAGPVCQVENNIVSLSWKAQDDVAIDHYDLRLGFISDTISGDADDYQGEVYGNCEWILRAVDEAGNTLTASGSVSTPAADSAIVLFTNNQSARYGATCDELLVQSPQVLHVTRGGIATRTSVDAQGKLQIYSGGTANSTSIQSGGTAFAFSGGRLLDTVIESSGWLCVYSNGSVENTVIQDGAQMDVNDGGSATATTIASGGMLIANSGATLRGLSLEAGAVAHASAGVLFDFDLRDSAPGDAPSISGFDRFTGAPSFTITVLPDQENGLYRLADGAAKNFTRSITVGDIDNVYGELSANGAQLRTSSRLFRLIQEDGELSLSIEALPLAPSPVISADNRLPTNQDVTLLVQEDPAFAKVEYSLDQRIWSDYGAAGLVVSENRTVWFRSTDHDGFFSEIVSFTVDNIDKSIEAPQPYADIASPTNRDVTVSLQQNSDYVKVEYSLNGTDWLDYTQGILFTENGSVLFRAEDEAGNLSETTAFTVDNIDKDAPDAPTAAADITETTTATVTVTAQFPDDAAQRQFSLDGTAWQDYAGGVRFSQNGTVWFRAIDAAGNLSELTSCTVDNILPFVHPGGTITEPDHPAIGTIGGADKSASYALKLETPGKFTLAGSFPFQSGSITIANGKKKVANGTISKGVLKFNSGKPALLDSTTTYTVTVTSKDKSAADYSFSLHAQTLFNKADNSDDSIANATPLEWNRLNWGEVWTDWVGFGDAIDYRQLTLESAAKLTFSISATEAATFNVWQVVKGKPKSLQATTLKANVATTTKPLLLDAGTYYLSMTSKNAAKGGSADFSVKGGAGSFFFTEGDNSDDTQGTARAFTLDETWADWVGMGDATDFRKLELANGTKLVLDLKSSDAATFTIWQDNKGKLKSIQATTLKANVAATTKPLLLNAGTYYLSMTSKNAAKGGAATYSVKAGAGTFFFTKGDNGDDTKENARAFTLDDNWTDWVGMGDETDFRKITLESAAKLVFDLKSGDAATFTIWQDNKGKLKSLQATTLKANVAATTKALLLDAGTYYLSMTAKNAKKGGAADYSVKANASCRIFPAATKNDNGWKDVVAATPLGAGELASGWVGFGDTADYFKLALPEAGTLKLSPDATTANALRLKQLKLTLLDAKGKSVSLANPAADNSISSKKPVAAGEYYLGVVCANPKLYDTSYAITLA